MARSAQKLEAWEGVAAELGLAITEWTSGRVPVPARMEGVVGGFGLVVEARRVAWLSPLFNVSNPLGNTFTAYTVELPSPIGPSGFTARSDRTTNISCERG